MPGATDRSHRGIGYFQSFRCSDRRMRSVRSTADPRTQCGISRRWLLRRPPDLGLNWLEELKQVVPPRRRRQRLPARRSTLSAHSRSGVDSGGSGDWL